MNKYVYRMLCKNYEQSAKQMIQEWRQSKIYNSVVKTDAMLEYQENLKLLRLFLDSNGYPMPRPKWVYDDHDQSTWLFTPQKQLNKSFMMLQGCRR